MAGNVICLDTNYLILGTTHETPESQEIYRWLKQGEVLCTSSICWYEFRCGPISEEQLDFMRSILIEIRPFTELESEVAGRLFEKAGRKRALKTDAMIAATCLVARARLATNNRKDFEKFSGIQFVPF